MEFQGSAEDADLDVEEISRHILIVIFLVLKVLSNHPTRNSHDLGTLGNRTPYSTVSDVVLLASGGYMSMMVKTS